MFIHVNIRELLLIRKHFFWLSVTDVMTAPRTGDAAHHNGQEY